MPRTARKKSLTGIYHVIWRGNNQQIIFECEKDYQYFIDLVQYYKEECHFKVYSYCLMDNHIHMLVKEDDVSLHIFMGKIATKFAKWYNLKYKRCGYLFQDRFKSEPVNDIPYFLTVFRYIMRNPVKAGVVQNIADYRWSSFSAFRNEDDSFVDINDVVECFADYKACMKYLMEKQEVSEERCMEYYSKKRIPDEVALRMIEESTGCHSPSDFLHLDLTTRNQYVKKMLRMGIPVRQLSRLTGVSRYIIQKIFRGLGLV